MNNNVFISYAKEDYIFAKELYNFLKLNEFNAWLDKECLLPGQNWDFEINRELRKADFIIILISNNSVQKRGYVQREYKLALKYYEEKLEDDIYLLPLKIDNCEVPFGFEKFQWLELNEGFGFYKVYDSLNFQRKKLELQNKKYFNKKSDFEFEEKKIIKEVGINPKKIIEVYYPSFTNISNDDLLIVNSAIENKILSTYSNFISPSYNSLIDSNDHNNQDIEQDWELKIKYSFKILNLDFICLSVFTSVFTGGAHGNYWTYGQNFRLNPFMRITINDIFLKEELILERLISLIEAKLKIYALEVFAINDINEFYVSPLKHEWAQIENILITQKGIVFIFHTYQITAFALGEHEILVTYEELLNVFPGLKPLIYLKEKTRIDI